MWATQKVNKTQRLEQLICANSNQQLPLRPALSQGYTLAICDSSVTFPFQLTPELAHRASVFVHLPLEKRAHAIFDYLLSHITYCKSPRDASKKYFLSTEVWKQKRGVCGEMTYLYVSMARFAGLRSGYVYVYEDYSGKKVNHACARVQQSTVDLPVYVDIAYKQYDILHRKQEAITDERAWELFRSWR